jgi:hypothetical protein
MPIQIGFILIGFFFGFGILCGLEDVKNKKLQAWLNKRYYGKRKIK